MMLGISPDVQTQHSQTYRRDDHGHLCTFRMGFEGHDVLHEWILEAVVLQSHYAERSMRVWLGWLRARTFLDQVTALDASFDGQHL